MGDWSEPKEQPVLTGTVFAVRREFLLGIGGFDPEFNIWGGGDDILLSLKVRQRGT